MLHFQNVYYPVAVTSKCLLPICWVKMFVIKMFVTHLFKMFVAHFLPSCHDIPQLHLYDRLGKINCNKINGREGNYERIYNLTKILNVTLKHDLKLNHIFA